MKKILTILTTIGIAGIVSGCSSMEIKKEKFVENFNAFQTSFDRLTEIENANSLAHKVLNKYAISVDSKMDTKQEEINKDQPSNITQKESSDEKKSIEVTDELNSKTEIVEEYPKSEDIIPDNSINNQIIKINDEISYKDEIIDDDVNGDEVEYNDLKYDQLNEEETDETYDDNNDNEEVNNEISTLYNLAEDIDNSCDEFCQLKQQLTAAIIETENLIQKLQNKKINLTREQRMFINEQSIQLKNLGRQLSNITTELSLNLSDLNQILTDNGQNINDLNLKYLIVLDNLINGNEMLESGLSSINLINQMFNLKPALGNNNPNHVLYGFKINNQQPIFKDYTLDENGNLIENQMETDLTDEELNENLDDSSQQRKNVDSYKNRFLKTNIDSYNNNINNIDSFFNTALLDNQFMYGNRGGYPYYNMYYGMNPSINNHNATNTTDCVNCNESTEHVKHEKNEEDTKTQPIQRKKRFNLTKNIDTFKDENEPTLKEKFSKIKSFFKFQLED